GVGTDGLPGSAGTTGGAAGSLAVGTSAFSALASGGGGGAETTSGSQAEAGGPIGDGLPTFCVASGVESGGTSACEGGSGGGVVAPSSRLPIAFTSYEPGASGTGGSLAETSAGGGMGGVSGSGGGASFDGFFFSDTVAGSIAAKGTGAASVAVLA